MSDPAPHPRGFVAARAMLVALVPLSTGDSARTACAGFGRRNKGALGVLLAFAAFNPATAKD